MGSRPALHHHHHIQPAADGCNSSTHCGVENGFVRSTDLGDQFRPYDDQFNDPFLDQPSSPALLDFLPFAPEPSLRLEPADWDLSFKQFAGDLRRRPENEFSALDDAAFLPPASTSFQFTPPPAESTPARESNWPPSSSAEPVVPYEQLHSSSAPSPPDQDQQHHQDQQQAQSLVPLLAEKDFASPLPKRRRVSPAGKDHQTASPRVEVPSSSTAADPPPSPRSSPPVIASRYGRKVRMRFDPSSVDRDDDNLDNDNLDNNYSGEQRPADDGGEYSSYVMSQRSSGSATELELQYFADEDEKGKSCGGRLANAKSLARVLLPDPLRFGGNAGNGGNGGGLGAGNGLSAGGAVSVSGRKIGRPRVCRLNTHCAECGSMSTPQWRYMTRQDAALVGIPMQFAYLSASVRPGSNSSLESAADEWLLFRQAGCNPCLSPEVLMKIRSLPAGAKICLCNACWLRCHKAKLRRCEELSLLARSTAKV